MATTEKLDSETVKMNNICRVCMREGGEYHSIFQKIKEESVAHMITVCANIEVSEHDGLPKQCCQRCIEGMFISFCMRKQCRESDLKLRSIFLSNIDTLIKKEYDPTFETVNLTENADPDFIKSEPVEDFVEPAIFQEEGEIVLSDHNSTSDSHSISNGDISDDDNSDSDNEANDRDDLDDDDDDDEENSDDDEDEDDDDGGDGEQVKTKTTTRRKRKKNSDRKKLKTTDVYVHRCCICRTDFQGKEDLEKHSTAIHTGEKSNDVSKPFECEVCFRRYFTKSSLKRHKREIQKITGTRCCGCKQDFKTREALQEHTITVHIPMKNEGSEIQLKGAQQYVCDVCYYRCATEMALSHHKTRVYLGKTYHCSQCEKSFMRKTTLISHEKRVHLGNKGNLLCSHCGKNFLDQSTLTNHEKTHVKHKPYECQVCMKTFASRTYLHTHMKLHTNPSEEIPCPICEKEFRSTELLKSHMNNTHNSENLFECNICLAKFKSVYYLKFHVRTHTGEKPHECEHCKKTFAHKSGYRRHIKTHTGEKPFMCNFCGKSFSNRPNMLLHEKYHTGDKNSACDVCGKTFVHSKYMKRHRQRHFMEKNRAKFEEFVQ